MTHFISLTIFSDLVLHSLCVHDTMNHTNRHIASLSKRFWNLLNISNPNFLFLIGPIKLWHNYVKLLHAVGNYFLLSVLLSYRNLVELIIFYLVESCKFKIILDVGYIKSFQMRMRFCCFLFTETNVSLMESRM